MPCGEAAELPFRCPFRHPRPERVRSARLPALYGLSMSLTWAVALRQPRPLEHGSRSAVPAHVMIQKSWRSSMVRAPQDHDAARAAVIQRVEPDLVLDGVDQAAEPGAQADCFPAGLQGALEDAELDPRAVSGQEGGHVFPPLVIGNVIGDQVENRRSSGDGKVTSSGRSGKAGWGQGWCGPVPWPGGRGRPGRTPAALRARG
jgi:hypothetical protein